MRLLGLAAARHMESYLVPQPGIEGPELEGGFLTTGPSENLPQNFQQCLMLSETAVCLRTRPDPGNHRLYFFFFLYSLFYLRTLYHFSKIPELGLWVNKCLIDYTNLFYSFPVSFLAFLSFLLKLLSFFR